MIENKFPHAFLLMTGRTHSKNMEIYVESISYMHVWEVSRLLYAYLDMTGTTRTCTLVNKVTDCICRHDQYFTS